MPLPKFRANEDHLRFSIKQSHAWIEHSPICTKIIDLDFNLQFMSSAGVKTLAISDVKQYYGKAYPFGFYPQSFRDQMSNNLRKARDTGLVIEQEAAVVDTRGNEVWFHSTISPVSENGDQIDYLMVVSIDVTARHASIRELEQLNDELERKVYIRTLKLENANKALHQQVETDFLTKLSNRLAFDRHISMSITSAKSSEKCLSLLMIDVDNFKTYNDKYGHDVGDLVLASIADSIDNSLLRQTDIAARIGGEEFAILLPETDVNAGFCIAERVRTNIEALQVRNSDSGMIANITVSIGVASLKDDELNATALLKQADKALYLAKHLGRNNSQIYFADVVSKLA